MFEDGGFKKNMERSETVSVQLAAGQIELKLHPRTNTLLWKERVQAIVPMCKLTQAGYEVSWPSSGCVVKNGETSNYIREC